jgi:hypothetical protein
VPTDNKLIRLTTTSYAVLSLLDMLGEATPYDLKQALEHSLENLWPAGREALRAWADSPGAPPSQYRDEGMLKVFAGADPLVVFAGRAEWHRSKLAEFEGYLESLRACEPDTVQDRPAGAEATLIGGIEYHRQMGAIFERLVESRVLAASRSDSPGD